MNCFEQRLVKNLDKIKTNLTAGEELAAALAGAAIDLARRDQAECVRNLKSRVLAEVKCLLDSESSDKSSFSKAKRAFAPASFAVGGLMGIFLHHDNPLATAFNEAGVTLGKNLPFGVVLIAIGKGGLPSDVKVIPLSRLARESGISESGMREILSGKGYFLITHQVFDETLDEVEHCVVKGVLSLPLPVTEFKKRIPPIILGPVTPVPGNKLHRPTMH